MIIFSWLADQLIALTGLEPGSAVASSVHFFVEDITKIFALLVVIIFSVGLVRYRLSPEKVRTWLETKGTFSSHVLAVMFGAITPFCSCSSVPLFIGFIEAGIPLGATMSFLITSPMINEVAVILLLSLLGWKLTLVYVAIGLTVGLMGGLVIHVLKLEHYVEEYVYQVKSQGIMPAGEHNGLMGEIKKAAGFGVEQVREIVGRIWIYVVAGVGIGALVHGFVPQDVLVAHAGKDNLFSVPVAVAMGIPLYSNVSGTIPVAEALLGKGLPVGTVIALMMSISALSFPEMVILRKVLKPQLVGLFALILGVSFIVTGYLLNILFS